MISKVTLLMISAVCKKLQKELTGIIVVLQCVHVAKEIRHTNSSGHTNRQKMISNNGDARKHLIVMSKYSPKSLSEVL
ncbi:hypothetical protein NY2A_b799R [Paramecium bursaria Chlorella virus NY2A]|uniref:Uncharacterized protein b799R n=1 Tax=Paramecium bursaria Chlorella virus NY2A TaxID=46021 RepID=A7IXX4_PBCVN|nr:hypothetical protein NY2A_b799R [Paramecium bursaria Chlorella virus NY2A]ABT15198.1 hypothetical protein NY2A_b799R [Paramecium bursaria Chlorella virus NY2A]